MSSRLERLKITLEVWGLQAEALTRSAIRLVAIAFVLVGAWNLLAAPVADTTLFSGYRTVTTAVIAGENGIVFFADILLIAAGSVIAWFV
jgi:hypothetical protein